MGKQRAEKTHIIKCIAVNCTNDLLRSSQPSSTTTRGRKKRGRGGRRSRGEQHRAAKPLRWSIFSTFMGSTDTSVSYVKDTHMISSFLLLHSSPSLLRPRNAMENTGTTLDSNGSGEDYDNMSESGSEIEFGGDGAAYNEGVPMEKYKALEMRLVAVVKKVKESKKEYKDMRRKFKKIKTDADNYKSEAEEVSTSDSRRARDYF